MNKIFARFANTQKRLNVQFSLLERLHFQLNWDTNVAAVLRQLEKKIQAEGTKATPENLAKFPVSPQRRMVGFSL